MRLVKYIKILYLTATFNKQDRHWTGSNQWQQHQNHQETNDNRQTDGHVVGKSLWESELECSFKSFFLLFSMCRELVQVVVAAVGEVGLHNLPKQIPFQEAVGHGQKLPDDLVEILESGNKRNHIYYRTNKHGLWEWFPSILTFKSPKMYTNKYVGLLYPIKAQVGNVEKCMLDF